MKLNLYFSYIAALGSFLTQLLLHWRSPLEVNRVLKTRSIWNSVLWGEPTAVSALLDKWWWTGALCHWTWAKLIITRNILAFRFWTAANLFSYRLVCIPLQTVIVTGLCKGGKTPLFNNLLTNLILKNGMLICWNHPLMSNRGFIKAVRVVFFRFQLIARFPLKRSNWQWHFSGCSFEHKCIYFDT